MTEDATPKPAKKKIRWGRIFGFLLFVAILGAAAYGLSWLNARTYYLVVDATEVRVGKGRMLPVGYDPFVPLDPALRKAYQPFELPGGFSAARGEQKLDDRVELDQALYRILLDASQFSLSRDNARTPKLLAQYLERLRALPGTNSQQRARIEQLAKEALFVEAKGNFEAGLEALTKAEGQLAESMKGLGVEASARAQGYADRVGAALRILRGSEAATAVRPAQPKLVPPKASVTSSTASSTTSKKRAIP